MGWVFAAVVLLLNFYFVLKYGQLKCYDSFMWTAKGLSHCMYMYPLSLNFSFLFILCHLYEGNKVKHCFPPHFTPVLKF